MLSTRTAEVLKKTTYRKIRHLYVPVELQIYTDKLHDCNLFT